MDTPIDLTKGLHQDYKPIDQPPQTYRNLINGNRDLNGKVTNERGTIVVHNTEKIVIGSCILDTEIILALYPSELGIINSSDQYSTITNNTALNFQDPLNSSTIFDYNVDIEAINNFKGDRIIYLVDGVNPDRAINIDDPTILTSSSFGDITQIQLNPILPSITIDSITDQGSLPTGVYQFATRLLTRSTNSTAFGELTPLIPVIDENSSLSFDQQDGAPPQSVSSKSINLIINNIDTSYSFIEIIAVTYIGAANITTSNVIARLPIDNRTSINFTYSTVDQNKEPITLEEITINPVNYASSKSIEQKDGILVRSNLKAEDTSFDFQLIANKVKIKYFIEEIPWQFGYKDPLTAAFKKSYRRGEVYSFAISPDYKSNGNSTAYHISAPFNSNTKTPANTTTKVLGTYTSLEEYPSGRDFPISQGVRVRHFVMPTVQQEPIFVNINGQIFIRLLGIQLDFSECYSLIPDDINKRLRGFKVLRQQRTDSNKSILAQGIAQPHYRPTNQGTSENNMSKLQAIGSVLYGNTGYIDNTTPIGTEVGFFSPETIIYNREITGSNLKLEPLYLMTGTQTAYKVDGGSGSPTSSKDTSVLTDYINRTNSTLPNTLNISANTPQYIPANTSSNDRINPINTTTNISNLGVNGYLFFTTNQVLPQNNNVYNSLNGPNATNIPEFFYFVRTTLPNYVYLNGNSNFTQEGNFVVNRGTSSKYLFNITRELPRQYGSIFDSKYEYISTISLNQNIKQIYGGDTFIGKFSNLITQTYVTNINNYGEIKFRNLIYYFVESDINVNYRHYISAIGKEGDDNYVAGTVPYYPKYSLLFQTITDGPLGIFETKPQLGHSRGYNKQYSFESNLTPYYPKQLAEEIVTNFSNRSIYSEQRIEGEQVDSYRIFLPNNYHDIPRDRGPIINTFVYNNTFFIHTTGALWKTAFNERVALAGNIGEVFLGNGGIFNRPSEPILTIDGGYAGIQTKHGEVTPYGYFFIDSRQKMPFLFNDQLQDIGEQGMRKFFNGLVEGSKIAVAFDYEYKRFIITQPYEGIGYGQLAKPRWTLTYHVLLKSWSSFHTYYPYWMIARNKGFYMALGDLNKGIFRHNIGKYGVYNRDASDTENPIPITEPMQIDIVSNDYPEITKIFDNLVFITTSEDNPYSSIDNDVKKDLYNTFSELQVYNETKNTGVVDIIVPQTFDDEFQILNTNECFAKLKNDEFRIAIPNDLVVDINIDIFDENNLDSTRDFRPRISGKWSLNRLTYLNSLENNRKFIIHGGRKIFRNKTNGRENIR